jgi:hypothetical protein
MKQRCYIHRWTSGRHCCYHQLHRCTLPQQITSSHTTVTAHICVPRSQFRLHAPCCTPAVQQRLHTEVFKECIVVHKLPSSQDAHTSTSPALAMHSERSSHTHREYIIHQRVELAPDSHKAAVNVLPLAGIILAILVPLDLSELHEITSTLLPWNNPLQAVQG